ncbi:hypothetical protein BASA61_006659 [Batrachochytrium salamandrivorans]|nr:hypothetical protein BASA61_006659 [Batrachochytrium salamandrivorans]
MNSYALQLQQHHQLALAQIYASSPYAQLDQYFGYWRQLPAAYPVVGYPSQWSLQNNGFCSATPQSDFFGNTQAYPYLSDSERRRIALEQGMIINIPITSKEDHDTLPEMIRRDSDNLPHIDVCFASVTEIEAQSLVEVVEVLEAVGAVTAQPHTSVHRTEDLEQALKKICVPYHEAEKWHLRIPHAWEAALPATPKKERFHVKPKKPQTHSVTQASGRQNISGDVRNHPDLISTVKKNRHNTNRDGQPKIGPIKWK